MKGYFKSIENFKNKIKDVLPQKGSKNENLLIRFISLLFLIVIYFLMKLYG